MEALPAFGRKSTVPSTLLSIGNWKRDGFRAAFSCPSGRRHVPPLHPRRFRNWIEAGSMKLVMGMTQSVDLAKSTLGAFGCAELGRKKGDAGKVQALLLQAGYLTIGSYDEGLSLCCLRFPNQEMRRAYDRNVVSRGCCAQTDQGEAPCRQFRLEKGKTIHLPGIPSRTGKRSLPDGQLSVGQHKTGTDHCLLSVAIFLHIVEVKLFVRLGCIPADISIR